MSEILFIASDPCILALVENLQQLIEPEICVESDYTAGIKKIFDVRPTIVFLQHMIENVACDKLANQVKMLLDGEAVPLVLLSEESGMSYGVVSTYEACFDLCLPLDELSLQVQQLLHTLPAIPWKESAAPEPQTPCDLPSRTTLEITVPAGDPDLALPFPWQGNAEEATPLPPAAWDGALEAAEGNGLLAEAAPPAAPGPVRPQFLDHFLEEQFAAKPLPSIFDEPLQQEKPAPKPAAAQDISIRDLHRIEREDPNLVFGSMSETRERHAFPIRQPKEPLPADQAAAFAPPLRAPAPTKAEAAPFPAEAASPPAGAVQQPARPEAEAPPAESPAVDEFSDQVIASLGIRNEHPWYRRGLVVAMVLVIGIASLDLFYTLHRSKPEISPGIGELDAALGRPQTAPPAPAAPLLPLFLPQVAADPGYPAGHPGWERYQADALEYLVYREKGSLRAIQVLSEERGAITPSFLKLCIRSSSGNEQFIVKKTEEHSGMQITAGALQNGGELLIYRHIPDGEIRGFVLSFPSEGQEPAQEVKK